MSADATPATGSAEPDDPTGEAAPPSSAPGAAGALLGAIVESAPDGIVLVDEEGRVVLTNPCLERQFGYPPGALLGRSIEVLVHEPDRDVHVAHRRAFGQAARPRPMGSGLALTGCRADGSAFPVEVALSPLSLDGRPMTLAIVRDTSERLAAEAAVRRLTGLLDSSNEGVFLASETGAIHYVNDGACALSGRDRAALLDHQLDEFFPGVTSIAAAAPGAVQQEARVTRPSGRAQPCDLLVQRFDWTDGRWLAVFARDATAHRQAQEQFWRAERALAVLEEQERIARHLHDDVIQRLFGIAASLEGLSASIDDPAAVGRLRRAVAGIDEAIGRIRVALQPTGDEGPGTDWEADVLAVAEGWASSLGTMPIVRAQGDADHLPAPAHEALVAAVHLALELIDEHHDVEHVTIELTVGDTIELIVSDDGEVGATPAEGTVRALAASAAAFGGTCREVPLTPRGTAVHWSVPVP